MGRMPLGAEGRSVKATLRITPQEKAMLVRAFGSDGKGLRALLDQYKAGWLEHPPLTHEALTQELARQLDVPREVLGEPTSVEQDFAVAQELDRVKQSLPIRDDTWGVAPGGAHPMLDDDYRNVGGDLVDPDGVLPIKTARGDAYLVAPVDAPLPGTIAAGIDSPDVPGVMPGVDPPAPAHRHKRGAVKATSFERGVPVKVYWCTVPGCTAELS